jgi:hypothetical protein
VDTTLAVLAGILGFAGVVSAIGGIMLAIRAARDKERKAAKAELDDLSGMLSEERRLRIQAERQVFDLTLLLARHGIDPPDDPPPVQ